MQRLITSIGVQICILLGCGHVERGTTPEEDPVGAPDAGDPVDSAHALDQMSGATPTPAPADAKVSPDVAAKAAGDAAANDAIPAAAVPPTTSLGDGLAVGPYHVCILEPDRKVACFGGGPRGTTPQPAILGVAAGAGHLHTCVLTPPGDPARVRCFGHVDPAFLPPQGLNPLMLAVGHAFACTVEADRRVVCWPTTDWSEKELKFAPPPRLRAKYISVNGAFSCAIGEDDVVSCWGLRPPPTPEGLKALHIAVGRNESPPVLEANRHACAVRLDNTVVCWGDDTRGELRVPAGLKAREVAVGANSSCALRLDDTVVCWGSWVKTVPMPADLKARALRAIANNFCAVKKDANVAVCWGRDSRGEITGANGKPIFVPPKN